MQSAREILDEGLVRDVVQLAIELSETRERLQAIMRLGICPHCGARIFEESTNAEAGN